MSPFSCIYTLSFAFSIFQRFEGEGEDVGDGFEDDVAIDDVETFGEGGVVLAGLLPAFVGQGQGIAQGGVGEGQRGGVGNGTGDVGHAVVNDAVFDINGFAVGGGA